MTATNLHIDLNRFSPRRRDYEDFHSDDLELLDAAVDDQYVYHPWDEKQIHDGRRVADALKAAAKAIVKYVPPSPDRTVALRKLRGARMDANSAITHGGKY